VLPLGHHEVTSVLHFIRSISGLVPVKAYRERVLHELSLLLPGVRLRLVELPGRDPSPAADGADERPVLPSVAVEARVAPGEGVDLSERDRAILEAVGPHIAQAYRNAMAFTELQSTRTGLERAVDSGSTGVVFLTPEGRVRAMTGHASTLLCTRLERDRFLTWARAQATRAQSARARAGTEAPPAETLVVDRPSGRMVARFLQGAPGQDHLLLIQASGSGDPQTTLISLGLTRREAEVLLLVAQGGSNRDVAGGLGVRPSTVKKHLEHVYAKLGVRTRTAAAARAGEALSAA
jgi:DNA-binding CsgD family transcriptional regulator